jgi:hypothetical protein
LRGRAQDVVARLGARRVLLSTMAPGVLRFVTHLDAGEDSEAGEGAAEAPGRGLRGELSA